MSPPLGAVVLWHIVAGAVLSVPYVWQTLRRQEAVRQLYRLLGTICAATGVGLAVYAALGGSVGQTRVLFLAHVVSGCIVTAWAAWRAYRRWKRPPSLPLEPMARPGTLSRAFSRKPPACTANPTDGEAGNPVSFLVAILLLTVSGGAFAAYTYAAEAYYNTLTATNAAQAGNPLFPAGTRFAPGGDWVAAPRPEECGAPGCHPAITQQWLRSAHARSEESPLYRHALVEAIRAQGQEGARWCRGCHAPLSPVQRQGHTSAKERGRVDCLSCHAMAQVPEPTGNGRAVYRAPPVYPFARDARPVARWLHGFLLRVRPQPHRAALAGPEKHASDVPMCIPCHRLSVTPVQNRYKFIRYDNTWADWQAGPYSGESLHTWGQVEHSKSCAACHFPLTAGRDISGCVHDHGHSARNPEQPALRVEIFALRRESAAQTRPEQLHAPLEGRAVVVWSGEMLRIDVLVENISVGHTFPTGVPDLRKTWISFVVMDARGRVRLQSGLRENDANAHRYGLLTLDRQGKLLSQGNLFDLVAPIRLPIVAAGEADVVRYRFQVPSKTGGTLRLIARLNYRLHQLIRLSEHTITLHVREEGPSKQLLLSPAHTRTDDTRAAERFYSYGVGLFLQNDLPRARRAFQQAATLMPGRADFLVALGRVYLAEGDLLAARAQFQQALRRVPGNLRAQAWLGHTHRLMGQYEEALNLLRPLAKRFPRDRRLWFNIGRSYFQSGRYEEAAHAFTRMLDIDPDDATAHFNLMDCYRRLRRISKARREEAIFRYLQDEELPTAIIEPFLRAHPEYRRETQPQHEHVLQEE